MKIKVFLQNLNDKEFANFMRTKYGVTNEALCKKNLFNINFLYTTTEIEVDDILTEKERTWLENYLRPFKDRVDLIRKEKSQDRYGNPMYNLTMWLTSETSYSGMEHVTFTPKFYKNEMFRGLEPEHFYSLEQLGLFLQEK